MLITVIAIFGFIIINRINDLNHKITKLADELKKQPKKTPEADKAKEEFVPYKPETPLRPVTEDIFEPKLPKVEEELVPPVIAMDTPPPIPVADTVIPPPPIPKPRKKINIEKYIGENLFGKIGILILVAGIGFFVKYAIDQNWINEVMRTALGFVCGIALLLLAGKLKKKYRAFSSLLAGGAFAVFYVTVAVAYHYYFLFSQPVAFSILVLITVGMTVLATIYDHRELAIIALLGGFISPFIVSSGQGNYMVLFTYILILNTGMFALSLVKKWAELPVISFVLTTFIMAIYTISSETDGYLDIEVYVDLPRHLFVFATLFYFIFLLPVLSILKSQRTVANNILLILVAVNNFVYLGFGLYYIHYMNLSFKADGLLSLFIGLVNGAVLFWLYKQKKDYKLLIHTMLSLTVVFVTITVPLQLDGNWIPLLWTSELLVMMWLYVKSRIRLYEYFSMALIILVLITFLAAIFKYDHYGDSGIRFLVTHLYTGLAFGVVALLISRYREIFDKGVLLHYRHWNQVMIILSAVIIYYVLAYEIGEHTSGDRWIKSQILFFIGYLSLFAVVLKKRFPITQNVRFYKVILFFDTLFFACDSYLVPITEYSKRSEVTLSWCIAIAVIMTFVYIGWQYYRNIAQYKLRSGFTVYFTLLATLSWLALENLFLTSLGLHEDSSAGLSVALSLAGFIQMALGMRLHFRVLRKLSLITLGIVLAKLILIDLWAMPTVGKIIVFILLGITLLTLSFLYQKLKAVLFEEDEPQSQSEDDEDW